MDNVNENLWKEYQNTHFLLTQPLSHDLTFAIVTAHNPFGNILTPSQNRLLDRQLQHKIQQLNSPYRSIVGSAPDRQHMEKSWAILIDKEQALALGREFKQHAIYYVNKGLLSLISCIDVGLSDVEMGAFNQRTFLVSDLPDFSF